MIDMLFAAGLAAQSLDGAMAARADTKCSTEQGLPNSRRSPGNTFVMTRKGDGLTYVTIVVPTPPPDWKNEKFSVQLPSGDQLVVPSSAVSVEPKGAIQVDFELSDPTKAKRFQGGTLTIGDVRVPIEMWSGSTVGSAEGLRRCGDAFMRELGVDPTSLIDVDSNDVIKLFSIDDYPPAARRAGVEGGVMIAFSLNPRGRVTSCKIAISSGSDLLDARTCEVVIKRGRFPRDLVGTSTRWSAASIQWRLTSRN